jgi:hypothetical protein
MTEKDVKEASAEIPPEERAKAWEDYVRTEVNALLDTFLPESISGNVGVKYEHPVKKVSPKTGKPEFDEKKATGVYLSIMFEFAAPIDFFDEKPKDAEQL